MIRTGERIFIDTGAWIALAVVRDSMHERAKDIWARVTHAGARPVVSGPVVLETFTYLQRKGSQELAVGWWESLSDVRFLERVDCTEKDIKLAMVFFSQNQFHKLSLVDATSFVLMRKLKLRVAFSFDTHFAAAGFRLA